MFNIEFEFMFLFTLDNVKMLYKNIKKETMFGSEPATTKTVFP